MSLVLVTTLHTFVCCSREWMSMSKKGDEIPSSLIISPQLLILSWHNVLLPPQTIMNQKKDCWLLNSPKSYYAIKQVVFTNLSHFYGCKKEHQQKRNKWDWLSSRCTKKWSNYLLSSSNNFSLYIKQQKSNYVIRFLMELLYYFLNSW